ncbi:MAG: flavodoxin [Phototrophicales bacterium]|nr:MAG: flavodoxin [Phototrophicales bacterium]RMG70227.1 MAG: flavodoxin [Chloroflexota bacterium]
MANKIGLFFGSSTGNTEAVSYQLQAEINSVDGWECDVHNIGASTPDLILKYNYLIFGIPTWNTGELQDDWDIFLPRIAEMDFKGKKIALFGLGDQNGYGYNFLDALGVLADEVLKQGADLYGMWKNDTYQYEESKAEIEDHFMGLGVDQEGQSEMTPQRIKGWVQQVIAEFSQA